MKKKILSVVLSLAMAVSMCACGAGKGSENKDSGEMAEVTLGTTSWPTNMFFYLAKEKGIFEKNGVNVNIQDFSSTTESTNAFVGGNWIFVPLHLLRPFHHLHREENSLLYLKQTSRMAVKVWLQPLILRVLQT